MIRTRKIRGQKRILDRIEHWRNFSIQLDMDEVMSRNREYMKVYVSPFSNLDIGGSKIPIPKGKVRNAIIGSLFDIYDSWKQELDKLEEHYYLKIWFYPENVAKSQVVCAIREMVNWYDITFYKPDGYENKKLDSTIFGNHSERAKKLTWTYSIEELSLEQNYVADPYEWYSMEEFYDASRWYNKKMKQPHRIIKNGDYTYHNFPQYKVWIGGTE